MTIQAEHRLLPLPIEPLALCAFADGNFALYREHWRSFLRILLPTLLERESGEIDEMIEHAVVRDWTDLVAENRPGSSVASLIRHISGSLSLQMGQPSEMGFAAFLDCALPTRLHWVPGSIRELADEKMFVGWLARVSLAQSSDDFSNQIEVWREVLNGLPLSHLQISAS